MNKINALNAAEEVCGIAPKKSNYVSPLVKLKSVAVEDGFGTSQFRDHLGMTEQMNVVSWN